MSTSFLTVIVITLFYANNSTFNVVIAKKIILAPYEN